MRGEKQFEDYLEENVEEKIPKDGASCRQKN